VDVNDSAVERNCFYFQAEDLLLLKALKYAVKNTVLAPAVHARVNAMPAPEVFREAAPLAPMLRNIQDRIQHLEIVDTDIASLARKVTSPGFLYQVKS